MKQIDDFWTEHTRLLDGTFPYFDRSGTRKTPVWGKLHVSTERFFDASQEIVPNRERQGERVYVMLHPYVLQPKLTMTIGLYKKPKQYADQDSAIGENLGTKEYQTFLTRLGFTPIAKAAFGKTR